MATRSFFENLNIAEARYCRAFNQHGNKIDTQTFFNFISRLGDGVFWYVLMFLLPAWYGEQGLYTTMQMLFVGIVSLIIYKILKQSTCRDRPCDYHPDIMRHAPMLDKYSFPSGHTMHAVGFTLVIMGNFPELGLLITPFVFLVASSRLILGLHYPSDVIAGAFIGGSVAWASFQYIA